MIKYTYTNSFGVVEIDVQETDPTSTQYKLVNNKSNYFTNFNNKLPKISKDICFDTKEESIIYEFKKVSKDFSKKKKRLEDKLKGLELSYNNFKKKYNVDELIKKYPEKLI